MYLTLTPFGVLLQVANCALWTTYGWFAVRDIFVWGLNPACQDLSFMHFICAST